MKLFDVVMAALFNHAAVGCAAGDTQCSQQLSNVAMTTVQSITGSSQLKAFLTYVIDNISTGRCGLVSQNQCSVTLFLTVDRTV